MMFEPDTYLVTINDWAPVTVNGPFMDLVEEALKQLSGAPLKIVVKRISDGEIVVDWTNQMDEEHGRPKT